ncbi:methyl-accepting chemotaxis protein [Arcobacter sp. YIC-464]|uniref:methyl-accepting chemotaxis protein n=1 Tax=Arcobacter sp. YIC-464 TaxID=3376631 RepID=UPI003C24F74A
MNKNHLLASITAITTIIALTFLNKNPTYLIYIISSLSILIIMAFNFIGKENNNKKTTETNEENEKNRIDNIFNEEIFDEIQKVTELSSQGEYDTRITNTSSNEKINIISKNINNTLDSFRKTIDSLNNFMDNYNNNNFTIQIENIYSNDLKDMIDEINQVNIKISQMLLSSLKNNTKLSKNSDILKGNINALSKSVIQQAATLEETASAIEQITSTIINNNSNVSQMIQYSQDLNQSINKGYHNAKDNASIMDEINNKTKSIEEAIAIIDQIAFQTNILSLNAAVEAATAGEAGKGFAVVAQEVRNLATRSAEAAHEIKTLVGDASDVTTRGKKASDEMINEYEIINENIVKTRDIMNNVFDSLKEQKTGIEQINNAVSQIDKATQENASKAQDTMNIADINDQMAKNMVIHTNKTKFFGREEFNSNS